jgi:hypothetical protein
MKRLKLTQKNLTKQADSLAAVRQREVGDGRQACRPETSTTSEGAGLWVLEFGHFCLCCRDVEVFALLNGAWASIERGLPEVRGIKEPP